MSKNKKPRPQRPAPKICGLCEHWGYESVIGTCFNIESKQFTELTGYDSTCKHYTDPCGKPGKHLLKQLGRGDGE